MWTFGVLAIVAAFVLWVWWSSVDQQRRNARVAVLFRGIPVNVALLFESQLTDEEAPEFCALFRSLASVSQSDVCYSFASICVAARDSALREFWTSRNWTSFRRLLQLSEAVAQTLSLSCPPPDPDKVKNAERLWGHSPHVPRPAFGGELKISDDNPAAFVGICLLPAFLHLKRIDLPNDENWADWCAAFRTAYDRLPEVVYVSTDYHVDNGSSTAGYWADAAPRTRSLLTFLTTEENIKRIADGLARTRLPAS